MTTIKDLTLILSELWTFIYNNHFDLYDWMVIVEYLTLMLNGVMDFIYDNNHLICMDNSSLNKHTI